MCGDTSHQISIALLILQLCRAKNARGISVKTQELRLLVFFTRYLDLFTKFYSMYNSVVKIGYILSTAMIIVGIKYLDPIKSVYNTEQDSFPHWKYCVAPCIVLAIGTHLISSPQLFSFIELFWTFSIYLESVAFLPQWTVLRKHRLVENLTGKFIFFLGMYRFLYILNWMYRASTEFYYEHNYVVYTCGIVQTLLYADFFYQYTKMSRLCGFARGKFLQSDKDDDNNRNSDEDDDTGLIFELSASPENPRTINATDAMEPLIVASEESQQMTTLRSRENQLLRVV